MAQLSLFDALPPEPKVPRPPARTSQAATKKTSEETLATKESALENKQTSSAFHFEPAPVYPDEIIVVADSTLTNEASEHYSSEKPMELPVIEPLKGTIPNQENPVEEVSNISNEQSDTEQPGKSETMLAENKETQKPTKDVRETVVEQAMPSLDLKELTKQYYSISEVSAMFNVNASHLRYWEKEFPAQLGKVRKNGKGDRFYTPKNIEQLHVLFYLVKTKKMTLEGARNYLKQKKRGAKSELDAVTLLQQVREFLVSLKKELND